MKWVYMDGERHEDDRNRRWLGRRLWGLEGDVSNTSRMARAAFQTGKASEAKARSSHETKQNAVQFPQSQKYIVYIIYYPGTKRNKTKKQNVGRGCVYRCTKM